MEEKLETWQAEWVEKVKAIKTLTELKAIRTKIDAEYKSARAESNRIYTEVHASPEFQVVSKASDVASENLRSKRNELEHCLLSRDDIEKEAKEYAQNNSKGLSKEQISDLEYAYRRTLFEIKNARENEIDIELKPLQIIRDAAQQTYWQFDKPMLAESQKKMNWFGMDIKRSNRYPNLLEKAVRDMKDELESDREERRYAKQEKRDKNKVQLSDVDFNKAVEKAKQDAKAEGVYFKDEPVQPVAMPVVQIKVETPAPVKPMINITKEEFESYEDVRVSGVTNMFAVNVVCSISGLSKEKVMAIMKSYGDLMVKYPDVRKE
jgi:hypothetical protein